MDDLLQGTPYRFLAHLGAGSLGDVVLAEDAGQGRTVTLNIMHPEASRRAELVARMRAEARALARVDHPNLARVLGVSEAPSGRALLILEPLSGRTLAGELAERGALPSGEAVSYVRQALSGLGAAHAAGVLHRDLKLSSLALCGGRSGLVKVLDFGVAKLLGRTVAAQGRPALELDFPLDQGALFGAPRCLSPEQVRGAKADARADVYAAGVVLYTLLAGRGPFDHAEGPLQIAEAHAFEAPLPPSAWAPYRIAPDIERAVMRALAKQPSDRFPTAAAMAAELARAASRQARSTIFRDAAPAPLS